MSDDRRSPSFWLAVSRQNPPAPPQLPGAG